MKKFILPLLLLSFLASSAADLVVRENGVGGAYSNITDAINAAVAGDRIIIKPKAGGAPYVESLYVSKNLQFLCEDEGEKYTVQGSVSITPSTPIHVVIIGMKITGNISATANGPASSRSTVKIMYCEITGNVDFAWNNYDLTLANNVITSGWVQFRAGKMIGNSVTYTAAANNAVTVSAESGSLAPALCDSIIIIGNTLVHSGSTTYSTISMVSTNYYYHFWNNFVKYYWRGLNITAWKSATSGFNEIINNTFYQTSNPSTTNYSSYLATIPTGAKLKIYNNAFYGVLSSYTDCGIYGSTMGAGLINNGYNHFSSGFDASYFIYNISDDGTNSLNSSFSVDVNSGVATGSVINAGHPDEIYYDIDLTRNDVGCYGGSFTFSNFSTVSEVSGRVYYIDMPRRVISGNPIRIKAESYDK